jgi:hypothetical protein
LKGINIPTEMQPSGNFWGYSQYQTGWLNE